MTMLELDKQGLSPGQRAMLDACPMVSVPPLGQHVPLAEAGRRWVMAADGLYLEARSLALHVMVRVSELVSSFGAAAAFVRPIHGKVPQALLDECVRQALRAGRNETAALIHWNPSAGRYDLTTPTILTAGTGHVTYRDESLDDLLVVDFHSHGHYPAFFSKADDASDLSRMGPYIASVAGNCGSSEMLNVCSRVCLSPYLVKWNPVTANAS